MKRPPWLQHGVLLVLIIVIGPGGRCQPVLDDGWDMCATCPGLKNPCLNETFKQLPFCNPGLPVADRVADAVGRLTLGEKLDALSSGTKALPSLGLPAYNWWSEATHGISHVRFGDDTPWASNFALPITTAGSFNRTLWRQTGAQIGREARAFMNRGNAYSTFWAPVVNLASDPRWGRNLETPGEDPYLTGQYSAYFVQGLQESPEDPSHLQAAANCKHLVAHQMEDWNHTDRTQFNAVVSKQDLLDTYMPPFQDCVEMGRVAGLMCSYNAVNGVPSCANGWLQETMARGQWGFDGYITSDCGAVESVYQGQNYTRTPAETVRAVFAAGTDLNCGYDFTTKHAQAALDEGLISMADLDARLTNIFRTRFRLAHFDETPMGAIGSDQICTHHAVAVAMEGSLQGTVLLKNNGTLPWPKGRSAAVIGPNSNVTRKLVAYYGPRIPCFERYWTMVDAVARHAKGVSFHVGVPNVTSDDSSLIAEAVEAAARADQVVLAVGQDGSIEQEGRDRTSIALSGGQLRLVEAVTAAAKSPVVVVVLTGGAVDVSPLLANSKVGAILQAGQPVVTVLSVGDLIYGVESPSGRMVQTIYPASFVDELSMFDLGMRPGPSAWPPFRNPGRTYRFYTGQPVVPFGFGLSYSTFTYEVVSEEHVVGADEVQRYLADAGNAANARRSGVSPVVVFAVRVTNTGQVAASDAVLGFLVPPSAGEDGLPLQSLFGFERLHLRPGESKVAHIGALPLDFTRVSRAGDRTVLTGSYRVHFGVRETLPFGMGFAEAEVRVASPGLGGDAPCMLAYQSMVARSEL